MKKIIIIVAFLLTCSIVTAQPIKIGVKAGVSMLSTNVNGVSDAASKFKANDLGFTLGIVSRISIPVVGLYLQPELVYNNAKYKITTTQGKISSSYNNLELPVLLGFKFLFVRINAGPVFNLKTFESKDVFNVYRPNMGYTFGAGVSLGKFDVDLRYQGYFSKKVDSWSDLKWNDTTKELKVGNKFLTLTAGIFF